jgi:dihydrofolate reductase
MVDTPKIVFSKALSESTWDNTEVNNGDLTTEINKIKSQDSKDIIMYGGAGFAASVIKAGLIDEFHLFVNPAAAGKGMAIFNTIDGARQLKLIKATPLQNGIVVLCYEPVKG